MLTRNVKASSARTLGLLLIAFIFYGTTVEAAHRHGRILEPSAGVSSVTDPATADTSSRSRIGCHDCLICQLHQNFSTGLISIKPIAEDSASQLITWRSNPLLVCSIRSTPSSGRAPPSFQLEAANFRLVVQFH